MAAASSRRIKRIHRLEADATPTLPASRFAGLLKALLRHAELAVAKLARFSEQDQADILALAAECDLGAARLCRHATEAMGNHIGDKRPLLTSLDLICRAIELSS